MPKTHELKIWPKYFDQVRFGEKRYEVRKFDREYEKGDRLILAEWDPETENYTGRHCEVTVTHITYPIDPPHLLPMGVCVMGVEVLP